jgi:hypothetical protein
MTRCNWFVASLMVTGSIIAADSGAKDEVKSAAKKLAAKTNYSWRSTVESPDSGAAGTRFRIGPTDGKTEKDGFTILLMARGDNNVEAVLKGGKGALKGPNGWVGLAEAAEASAGGQRNAGAFIARSLQSFKTPAAQVEDLVAKAKDLKKTDDSYAGDLTEDGVKELLTFGRRGNNAPAPRNAAGTVKFWIKDGTITKYQFTVQGTISFNNNDINVDRTTTVEIKDVDSTKVDVPDEAKSKMSSTSS